MTLGGNKERLPRIEAVLPPDDPSCARLVAGPAPSQQAFAEVGPWAETILGAMAPENRAAPERGVEPLREAVRRQTEDRR